MPSLLPYAHTSDKADELSYRVSVNECYDYCLEPRKVFDLPECNGISGKQLVCEYFKNPCPGKEYEPYGGCYAADGPTPLFAAPECPPPDESCRICIDNVNDCGKYVLSLSFVGSK